MTSNTIIQPTIGRRLWYWPNAFDRGELADHKPETPIDVRDPAQPCDAGVVLVHSERLVNLSVTDHSGHVHRRVSVPLVQEGDEIPDGPYAQWMPYQTGQAKAAAPQPSSETETRVYGDGTTATGAAPLPDQSPAEQAASQAKAE